MTTYNTGNAIGSTDARDLYDNVQNLDHMANSSASTYNDRRGVQRRTLAGLEAEFPNAQANSVAAAASATAAAASATQAANEATSAATAVDLAFAEATAAQAARTGAESARDAAMLSAGVYATTAAGLAATVSGRYFSVPSADSSEYLILYLNNAGAAVEQKRYPSKAAVDAASARVDLEVLSTTGKNLFNPAEARPGFYFSPGANAIVSSPTYRMSGWIPVVAGQKYSLNGIGTGGGQIAFYATKESANAISTSVDPTVVAPAGATWAVFNITNEGTTVTAYDGTCQFEQSPFSTSYEAYVKKVPSSKLPAIYAVAATAAGKNLFDKSQAVGGQVFSTNTSKIIASSAYRRTGFIPVVPGKTYVKSGFNGVQALGFFAAADATTTAISSLSINNGIPFTVPAGANYVVMNITASGVANLAYDNAGMVEEGISVTTYEAYQRRVASDQLDPRVVLSSDLYDVVSKNLFNPAAINWTKRLSPSTGGVVESDANQLITTSVIAVTEGAWYSFGGSAATTTVALFANAADTTPVQTATLVTITGGKKFQIPTGLSIKWMRMNVIANPAAQTVTGQLQINAGETLSAWSAYAERMVVKTVHLPDPASQPEYVQKAYLIEARSFNLIDPAACDYVRRYSTGNKAMITDPLAIVASDYIPVVEGEWYTVSGSLGVYGLASGSTACQGGYFAGDGLTAAVDNITFVTPVTGGGACFQVPTGRGITHVVISLRPAGDVKGATTLNGDVQLELGEMATTYRPYLLEDKVKTTLLPEQAASGAGTVAFDAGAWYKFTRADEGGYLADKFPLFRRHWIKRDKDLCVVNTGTSLTARSTEHCTDHPNANKRPPLMHSRNMASILWDRIRWDGQQYRRYDYSGFFTESVGTFATATALAEWDDGPYRAGLTRYSETTGASVAFTIPVDAWQFNFIYRTDTTGVTSNLITVAEGNGKIEVQNDAGSWVEANGFTFSMRESAPVTRVISVPLPASDTFSNYTIASKGNTTYQKRLKMRCRSGSIDSRSVTKAVTITGQSAGRFMYWGVEWSPREFMVTYINAARGSHNTQATSTNGLPKFQDNEIWGFKPDLLFFELPIHNDGTDSATPQTAGYWSRLANNFVFRPDYELSLKTRGAFFGLTPEIGMFTSSIAWNFGGIADDGTLKYNIMADGRMMTSLDKFNEAYLWVLENHPEAVCINAAKRWVDAAIAIFGDLKTATLGSGKAGDTFTNEGSHWNDTGSMIIAKALVPLFDFTR